MALVEPGHYLAANDGLAEVHRSVWDRIGRCGTWWTGEERVAIVAEARQALTCELCIERSEVLSPMMIEGDHESVSDLPSAAIDLIHRLTTDPGRLSREWAVEIMDILGEEAYVEIATIVSLQSVIDSYSRCLGLPLRTLPIAGTGIPSCERPEGVGDVGAWVSQTTNKELANVSRAASLVPETESLWREIVQAHYSRGPEFANLIWDRDLSRPQVELLASTVSALNECFY